MAKKKAKKKKAKKKATKKKAKKKKAKKKRQCDNLAKSSPVFYGWILVSCRLEPVMLEGFHFATYYKMGTQPQNKLMLRQTMWKQKVTP